MVSHGVKEGLFNAQMSLTSGIVREPVVAVRSVAGKRTASGF